MIAGGALVTGAGSRLGRAMARALASRGYNVAVHYGSSGDDAAQTVAMIKEDGGSAIALKADLLDPNEAVSLIAKAVEMLGQPLSVLVNNASIFEPDSLQTMTGTSWQRSMGSNLHAPAILTQHFSAQVPDIARDEAGEALSAALVVNMIDQRVSHPHPDFFSYTLAKTALLTMTELAAQELAPRIRVNGIAPGPTLQSIHQSVEEFRQERAETPLSRGANCDDIIHALDYFLDAPAVTGQVLYVDGGQHL